MMLIGWTTVSNRAQADALARGLIDARLAACVQIESPVVSHYVWEGRREETVELRLAIKFLPERQAALQAWLEQHHPYSVHQWIVVRAEHVTEKYLSWARANSSSAPL